MSAAAGAAATARRAAASGLVSPLSRTGCLQYREYDLFTRQLKRVGHPTDASQDYDYTDCDGASGSPTSSPGSRRTATARRRNGSG